MNNIQAILETYITEVAEQVDGLYALNEAKLTDPDVKSLFKYLSARRTDTDGLITKVNKFTSAIVNSPTYKQIKSSVAAQGANASKYVATKTTEVFKALAELANDRSYQVKSQTKQSIKDIYDSLRNSPELRPIALALMMKAQEYIINKDESKLDSLIDLTKYTIKQHQSSPASKQFNPAQIKSLKTSKAYNDWEAGSKRKPHSLSADEVNDITDINKLSADLADKQKPKSATQLSSTEVDNLYDLSKLQSTNAGKIDLADKGIVPQTATGVSAERLAKLSLTRHTRNNLKKLNQVSKNSESATKYLNSFVNRIEELPVAEQNSYVKKWVSHLAKGVKSRLSESVTDDFALLTEDGFLQNKLKRFGQRTGLVDKDPAEFDELMREWQSRGQPNEIEEIRDILDDFGFSKREIDKAFKSVGIDDTESFSQLAYDVAKVSERNKLSPLVLAYLRKYFPKDSAKASLKENVAITNDFAMEVFKTIASRAKPVKPITNKDTSIMKDLILMANKVRSLTDANAQLMLIREMIVLMSDHANDVNLSKYKRIVANLMSDADLPETAIADIFRELKGIRPGQTGTLTNEAADFISTLLEVSELSWDDLQLQLTENNEVLLTSSVKTANIIKTLESVQQFKIYGRSRKCL